MNYVRLRVKLFFPNSEIIPRAFYEKALYFYTTLTLNPILCLLYLFTTFLLCSTQSYTQAKEVNRPEQCFYVHSERGARLKHAL